MRDEARPIERARFLIGEAFADDEGRGRPLAQETARRAPAQSPSPPPRPRLSRRDLMQRVVRKAAAKRRIERARERKRRAGRSPAGRPSASISAMARRDAPSPPPCRLATFGPRPIVRHLFLFWTENARESRTGRGQGRSSIVNVRAPRLLEHYRQQAR